MILIEVKLTNTPFELTDGWLDLRYEISDVRFGMLDARCLMFDAG